MPEAKYHTNTFPPKVELVDTGERRYPTYMETYMFHDKRNGSIDGPFVESSGVDNWSHPPEQYAIYRVVRPAIDPRGRKR